MRDEIVVRFKRDRRSDRQVEKMAKALAEHAGKFIGVYDVTVEWGSTEEEGLRTEWGS
jgi:hypothetical protein